MPISSHETEFFLSKGFILAALFCLAKFGPRVLVLFKTNFPLKISHTFAGSPIVFSEIPWKSFCFNGNLVRLFAEWNAPRWCLYSYCNCRIRRQAAEKKEFMQIISNLTWEARDGSILSSRNTCWCWCKDCHTKTFLERYICVIFSLSLETLSLHTLHCTWCIVCVVLYTCHKLEYIVLKNNIYNTCNAIHALHCNTCIYLYIVYIANVAYVALHTLHCVAT